MTSLTKWCVLQTFWGISRARSPCSVNISHMHFISRKHTHFRDGFLLIIVDIVQWSVTICVVALYIIVLWLRVWPFTRACGCRHWYMSGNLLTSKHTLQHDSGRWMLNQCDINLITIIAINVNRCIDILSQFSAPCDLGVMWGKRLSHWTPGMSHCHRECLK